MSIKILSDMDFDIMPTVRLNVVVVGITTSTVRNVDGKSVLKFYVEENLRDREPKDFWVQITHDPNLRYLANKTNTINQTMRSTTAIIMGMIRYEPPIIDQCTQEEVSSELHILKLALVSSNRNNNENGQQSLNVPWLTNAQSSRGSITTRGRTNRTPRGATPRTSKRGRTATLAQMGLPRNLSSALEANPISDMNPSATITTDTPITTPMIIFHRNRTNDLNSMMINFLSFFLTPGTFFKFFFVLLFTNIYSIVTA